MPGLEHEVKILAPCNSRALYRPLLFFFQHAVRARPDRGLKAVCQSSEQPRQGHFKPDVILGDIDGPAHLLPQCRQPECQTIAAPDFLVDLQKLSVFRTNAPEPLFQAANGFVLSELVGD